MNTSPTLYESTRDVNQQRTVLSGHATK